MHDWVAAFVPKAPFTLPSCMFIGSSWDLSCQADYDAVSMALPLVLRFVAVGSSDAASSSLDLGASKHRTVILSGQVHCRHVRVGHRE